MCAHTHSSSIPLEINRDPIWGKKKMSPGFLGLSNYIKKAPVIPVTSGTAKLPLRAQGAAWAAGNWGKKERTTRGLLSTAM